MSYAGVGAPAGQLQHARRAAPTHPKHTALPLCPPFPREAPAAQLTARRSPAKLLALAAHPAAAVAVLTCDEAADHVPHIQEAQDLLIAGEALLLGPVSTGRHLAKDGTQAPTAAL